MNMDFASNETFLEDVVSRIENQRMALAELREEVEYGQELLEEMIIERDGIINRVCPEII